MQLRGRKRWRVYQAHPASSAQERHRTAARSPASGPAWEGVLADGDTLYIPRGWWHEAFPLNEPSLHLTVSLTPPTAMDYLGWVMSQLRRHAELRASLPDDAASASRDRQADSAAGCRCLESGIAGRFPGRMGRQYPAQSAYTAAGRGLRPAFAPSRRTAVSGLPRFIACLFRRQDGHFAFRAAGRLWSVPGIASSRACQVAQCPRLNTLAELNAALDRSISKRRPGQKPYGAGARRRGAGGKDKLSHQPGLEHRKPHFDFRDGVRR